jgi:hypothetical protein
MSSIFDFDDSHEIVFQAKTAGKSLISAKYAVIQDTGDFLFNSHTDGEFAQRCAMIDDELSKIAYNKLANISDSKTKLVKALHTEWTLRHAKCADCNCGQSSEKSGLPKVTGSEATYRVATPVKPHDEKDPECGCISCSWSPEKDKEWHPHGKDDGARRPWKTEDFDWQHEHPMHEAPSNDGKDYIPIPYLHGPPMHPEWHSHGKDDGANDIHGTATGYDSGCRCDDCKNANHPVTDGKDYGGHVKILPNEGEPLDWEKERWASKKCFCGDKNCPLPQLIEKHDSEEDNEGQTIFYIEKNQKTPKKLKSFDYDFDNDDNKIIYTDHYPNGKIASSRFANSSLVVAHMADGDACPSCDGSGCNNCMGTCDYCGNPDVRGTCPGAHPPHVGLGPHEHAGDCPFCAGNGEYENRLQSKTDECPHCEGEGCPECWYAENCPSCGGPTDAYGDHYGSIGCPSDGDDDSALHDKLHDAWHAEHGDEPCTSVEDCQNKAQHYKNS